MYNQSIRTSCGVSALSRLFLAAALLFGASGMSACDGTSATQDNPDVTSVSPALQEVNAGPVINARDVANLSPNTVLLLTQQDRASYLFDSGDGPIDFSRLRVLLPDGGKVAGDLWLESALALSYRDLPRVFEVTWVAGATQVIRSDSIVPERSSCVCCISEGGTLACWGIACGSLCGVTHNQ